MSAVVPTLVLVIYTRYSSDLQSSKSCKDQEREVREALARMGIDHSKAIVIYDEAESGTKVYRDQFARLEAMVRAGEIAILAVDDQARLSRADNTFGYITDLVYSGGRFISTGEGIDTEQTGWELRVKVMELHNSTTIRELGRRVRRGQLGRVLSQLSAGDLCYGYESYLLHPEKAAESRGPKPERGVRIKEVDAKWVRQIFTWFNAGRSISWIAKELTRQEVPGGHRRPSNRWREKHVRKILANEKYVGTWRWGTTRTIRNSQGKKKQIPVPVEHHVVVQRDELRIIDEATWAAAQVRLSELKDQYGSKPGQKRRGPKVHHTALYPSSLLGGLIVCGECGARLWQQASGPRLYFGCPNRGLDKGCCELTTRVPVEKAEQTMLNFLAETLTSWPAWLEKALTAMRERIGDIARRVPDELADDERRLKELESQIANLVDALAAGRGQSQAVLDRLEQAEGGAVRLRQKIDDARKLLAAPVEMPDDQWVQHQLNDLATIIREGGYDAAVLLRKILSRIEADQVIPPGKARGYARLRFRLHGWETLRAILRDSDWNARLDVLLAGDSDLAVSDELVLDLGGPTLMDQWAPRIAELRAQGIKWTEIAEITDMDLNRVYRAWKRYVDATDVPQRTEGVDTDADAESSIEPLREPEGTDDAA